MSTGARLETILTMDYSLLKIAVTQHTTAYCSVQVVYITPTEGLIRKYYIPQSSTTANYKVGFSDEH